MKRIQTNKALDYKNGHTCEKVAQFLLMLKGYMPIAKNYIVGRGTGAGEIDLIMKKGKMLVFFEVKKRATFEQALHAITIENQARVSNASAVFLQQNPIYQNMNIRYDAIIFAPKRLPRHIKDAWRIL